MKKLCFVILLCAALLLSACGRQAQPAVEQAPAETTALVEPAPAVEAAAPDAGREMDDQQAALGELLSWIREYVTVGTAGSSLRAAAAAAELLDWAAGCTLDDAAIAAAYEAWYPDRDPDVPVDIGEQLSAVDYSIQMLTEGEPEQAKLLLEDAGCADCGYPWDAHAVAVADALMQAAGLR